MNYSNNIIDDLKYQYNNGGVIVRLIFVNVAVFVAMLLLKLILWLPGQIGWYHDIMSWVQMPLDFKMFIKQPWSLFTYMFLHSDTRFLHIVFNMLIFFWFGRIFAGFLGEKRILSLYVLGGVSGGLLALAAYNLLPQLSQFDVPMVGASASVMAVMLATATYFPNYQIRLFIIGSVRIVYVAFFFVIIDIMMIPAMSNTGGHIAHLGGAIYGVLYAINLQRGRDWATFFDRFVDSLVVMGDRVKEFFKPKKKKRFKVIQKRKVTTLEGAQKKSPQSGFNRNDDKQEKIDEILDKISRSGYDSLTKDEKDFLFNVSKED